MILILAAGASEWLDDEALVLEFAASNIERPTEGAIACTVPAMKILEIERHPRIAYVRRISAYTGSLAS